MREGEGQVSRIECLLRLLRHLLRVLPRLLCGGQFRRKLRGREGVIRLPIRGGCSSRAKAKPGHPPTHALAREGDGSFITSFVGAKRGE